MEKQIKELIKLGYELKLIASEFNIPIDKLKQWESELTSETVQQSGLEVKKEEVVQTSATEQKQKTTQTTPTKPNNNSYLKMQLVIKRYKELFSGDGQGQSQSNNTETNLSREQLQEIQQLIATLEEKLKSSKNASKSDLKEIAYSIVREGKKIEQYFYLPLQEATQLNDLMNSDEMERMIIMWNPNRKETVSGHLKNIQKKVAVRFARAIHNAQIQTDDIETLEQLERKLTLKLRQLSPVEVDAARRAIQAKIQRLRTKKALDRIRNDIPANISQIITGLVDGKLHIEEARRVIEQEAKRKSESRPKTNSKFAITEEQEEKQIFIQIRTAIKEKSETYPIKNPEATIELLQQLCGEGKGAALRIVVDNLISRKCFETAKRICRKFSSEDKSSTIMIYIKSMQEAIRNAEFREFVLTGINSEDGEKQSEYFDLIETGIKRGDIKPAVIILGKTQDGSRNITLADIWPGYEKPKKETNRG